MKTRVITIYLLVFIALLAVNMTLFSPMQGTLKILLRISFIIISAVTWFVSRKRDYHVTSVIAFSFLALNLAFLIVAPFTSTFLNLDVNTAKGLAFSKLSDSLIISFVIIISFLIARLPLKSIFLTKGSLYAGITIGLIIFILLGLLAFTDPELPVGSSFLRNNWIWILVFVMANGFMEELIFRGIFLEKLNLLFNHHFSIFMTSVCFAVPHIIVSYQPNVVLFAGICFVLGMICGYAMHYTRSIIAPALIHAGADLMIIVPIFASFGITG
jgi:membrane protease YdiL (CAAX protease family)